MSLILVFRHGPTDWSDSRRLQGRRDLPLSAAGRAEVQRWRLPEGLAEAGDWFASPLQRAMETAHLMGVEPVADRRLIEMDYGAWEGHRLADLRAADPDGMAAIEALGIDYRPPGGESPRMVQARLCPFLAERARAGRDTVAVCHKGVIRALYASAVNWVMQSPPPHRLLDSHAHLFSVDLSGSPRIARLNIPLDGRP